MPHGSLLRHMFKHGRHARNRSETGVPLLSAPEKPAPAAEVSKALPPIPRRSISPEKRFVEVLPEITEESSSENSTPDTSPLRPVSTTSDTASIITVIAAQSPSIDASAVSDREIIYASIDEANDATNAHLRTLGTTLALLEALEGFSPTVAVLLREFKEKKRECEAKLEELERFEEGVDGLVLADEVKRGHGYGKARA
ncbi:hypothetical protein PtrSN002B_010987 [Pyrenophora tritici-repentis]|uniref:Uncharacterized protein n=2 Tax=Pyrenophora tritici-repentis TaxID=45151 RepID=A0A2W1G5R9_9PLEO|nr:uncharacterized protein PTRG_08626 [Pyrenophora tritici-repentis Pt-1C-BFP]KAA8615417.1 hypothetical protein PtrV1_10813 [Pyrenophora tritici-repentis]EDU51545.1 predicted protein [Pyrenophora tritici-repentis Pt-1C-BFP]KAF7444008.1 hypothetical protein A1F99_120820 [Pyrenophora tritici-repentis]KAF7566259.1 hypothetical protein PtrM4_145790 [Pyrenophora tritici-repentis]KAG9379745.1 hypothetical protein A1F94_010101 [Pyrenophora tritici-repentis]